MEVVALFLLMADLVVILSGEVLAVDAAGAAATAPDVTVSATTLLSRTAELLLER
jgi:hypothetical protein